jgi:hypothetical protein
MSKGGCSTNPTAHINTLQINELGIRMGRPPGRQMSPISRNLRLHPGRQLHPSGTRIAMVARIRGTLRVAAIGIGAHARRLLPNPRAISAPTGAISCFHGGGRKRSSDIRPTFRWNSAVKAFTLSPNSRNLCYRNVARCAPEC